VQDCVPLTQPSLGGQGAASALSSLPSLSLGRGRLRGAAFGLARRGGLGVGVVEGDGGVALLTSRGLNWLVVGVRGPAARSREVDMGEGGADARGVVALALDNWDDHAAGGRPVQHRRRLEDRGCGVAASSEAATSPLAPTRCHLPCSPRPPSSSAMKTPCASQGLPSWGPPSPCPT
jgi:hypothetical protein